MWLPRSDLNHRYTFAYEQATDKKVNIYQKINFGRPVTLRSPASTGSDERLLSDGVAPIMNLFQPSVMLICKQRVGTRLRRPDDDAQTPLAGFVQSNQEDLERVNVSKELHSIWTRLN